MRMIRKRDQRGDTIVEVLIAIAVVSLVLVTAYATSTRNINTIQDTQEHSEALQLAQTQIEYLHNVAQAQRPSNGGCFDNAGVSVLPAPDPNYSKCQVDSTDAPTSSQPQFTIQVKNTLNPLTHLTNYTVEVTWPSISNGQTNNVTLYYQQS